MHVASLSKTMLCLLLCLLFLPPSSTRGETVADSEGAYRTPLAGKAATVRFNSGTFTVPARDRSNQLALTLGGTLFYPALGSSDALPIAALYSRRETATYRSRLVFSVFSNELDLAVPSSDNLELLVKLRNDTSPFPEEVLSEGQAVKRTALIWGDGGIWLGAGYRRPVAPFQVDNDFRLQLYYQGAYLYNERTANSGSSVILPPDTFVHGLRLRVRYDGLRRNLMELPHSGLAAGADLEWNRRARWSDANYGGSLFTREETQEYLKLSGYALAALPMPGLSERNKLLISVYGGTAPGHDLDRFSAFRIGVGPFPSESDDLWRCPYPGATFNQFAAADYVISTLEYRRELLAFLYLHLRGTLAWVNRQVITSHRFKFSEDRGEAFSVGLTSGLPWNSTLYLEYSHDSGILRNNRPGDGVMILWSKSF